MKLFFLAIGDRFRASSRLRVWDHVDWFAAQGMVVRSDHVVPRHITQVDLQLMARVFGRYFSWAKAFFESDTICIQETFALCWLLPFRNLGKRRKVIFDFSDPVDYGSGRVQRLWRSMFRYVTRVADVVICENPDYISVLGRGNRPTYCYYGPVDARRYASSRAAIEATPSGVSKDAVHVGWTGSPSTLALIAPLFPVLDRLAATRSIRLTLLGVESQPYRFRNLQVDCIRWDEEIEFATVPRFDLGLFALDRSEHSKWRGAGKLSIYMAAGVAFIATDRGIGQHVMRDAQVGFRVADDSEWEPALMHAVDDAEARRLYSRKGMAFAQTGASYDGFRGLLLKAFVST